jgi:hypothetical protein
MKPHEPENRDKIRAKKKGKQRAIKTKLKKEQKQLNAKSKK